MRETALITGVGVLTGMGASRGGLSLDPARQSGFSWRVFSPGDGAPHWGCFVDDEKMARLVTGKGLRAWSRESRLLLAASILACADADLDAAKEPSEVGVFVGTVLAGLEDYCELYRRALVRGFDRVSPLQGPQTGYNAPASQVAIRIHAEGPNVTLSNGAVSSTDALAYAASWVERQWPGAILAGGVDVLSHSALQLLRSEETGLPRPFDGDRRGPVWGEAAALCVIEPARHMVRRGAGALAAVVGSHSAATGPGQESLERACETALRRALEETGLSPEDIGFVVASASGAVDTDAAEAHALFAVFGDRVPVCAVKGATGECLGASGTLQVALGVSALRQGTLPPTPGFCRRDPRLPPLFVAREATRIHSRYGVVVSLEATGVASVLLLSGTA